MLDQRRRGRVAGPSFKEEGAVQASWLLSKVDSSGGDEAQIWTRQVRSGSYGLARGGDGSETRARRRDQVAHEVLIDELLALWRQTTAARAEQRLRSGGNGGDGALTAQQSGDGKGDRSSAVLGTSTADDALRSGGAALQQRRLQRFSRRAKNDGRR